MKRIFGLGLATALGLASGSAWPQDFTAGKTPGQLFASDCSACHRTPAGLGKGQSAGSLTSFLKEHYTTKPESAGALAGYVAQFANSAPPPELRRGRRDAETAGVGEEGRAAARTAEDLRRRRSVSLSGDGEKPRARDKIEAPQLPKSIGGTDGGQSGEVLREAMRATPSALDGRAEASGPLENIRAYLGSGLSIESEALEAVRVRPAKPRRNQDNTGQGATEGAAIPAEPAATAKTATAPPGAAPAAPAPAPPGPSPVAAAPMTAPRLGH